MVLEGRAQRAPYTKAKLKKIFTSWHIYTLVLLYV
jgi:MFS transporter, ACS family, pantothenate transporter